MSPSAGPRKNASTRDPRCLWRIWSTGSTSETRRDLPMDKIQYCNDMLVRLEELLFHELSGCAAWKVELIGVDFIQSKNIKGSTPEKVIENCIKEITAAGLVKGMSYEIGGQGVKLELSVNGCANL